MKDKKKTGFYYEDYVHTLDKTNHRYLEIAGTYLGFQTSSIYLYHDVKPKYLYISTGNLLMINQ